MEAPEISDQTAAHAHFDATREIKLKDTYGRELPPTSYT